MEAKGSFGIQVKHWVVRQVLALPPSLIPGPEKSQLVSGDATVAEIDGLEPGTEYTVRVRTHVAGVDGAPTSVVVRTGEWLLASFSWPLCVSDCYPCSFSSCSVTFLSTLNHGY